MLTVHILLNCPFELFPISLLSLPLKKEIINREIGAHPACPHFSFFIYIMYELSLSVLVTYWFIDLRLCQSPRVWSPPVLYKVL